MSRRLRLAHKPQAVSYSRHGRVYPTTSLLCCLPPVHLVVSRRASEGAGHEAELDEGLLTAGSRRRLSNTSLDPRGWTHAAGQEGLGPAGLGDPRGLHIFESHRSDLSQIFSLRIFFLQAIARQSPSLPRPQPPRPTTTTTQARLADFAGERERRGAY
jgi:hypothetical protein